MFWKKLTGIINWYVSGFRDIIHCVCSVLFQLRSNLHFEIAKISADHNDLHIGLKHLEKVWIP